MSQDDYQESPQDVAADLAGFDEEFSGADVKPNDQRSIPDGTYTVRVDKCVLTRTKEKRMPMIAWQLVIVGGNFEGQRLFRNNVIQTDKNAEFLKKDLLTAGVEIPLGESLSKNVVKYCEETLDKCIEVKQQTRGENTNIYFNRQVILSGDGAAPASGSNAGAGSAAVDDDIPF